MVITCFTQRFSSPEIFVSEQLGASSLKKIGLGSMHAILPILFIYTVIDPYLDNRCYDELCVWKVPLPTIYRK